MIDNIDFSFFTKRAEAMGISLEKRQVCQFYDYYKLLIEWNEKINLTSITEFEDVFIKHFIDSISFVKAFDSFENCKNECNGKSLCDVGTGAGFPGIPVKILLPELKVTLFDSLDKRINFLREVIDKLELKDIEAIHGRVEDLSRDEKYRESFDMATARAVANLPVLLEYTLPFVKVGGKLISFKSEKASDEINMSSNALNVLGGEINRSIDFYLPETDLHRVIIIADKKNETPTKYPRKAGTPSKKPL